MVVSKMLFRNLDTEPGDHTQPFLFVTLSHPHDLSGKEALQQILETWIREGKDTEDLNESLQMGDGVITGLSLMRVTIEDILQPYVPKGWEILEISGVYIDHQYDVFDKLAG